MEPEELTQTDVETSSEESTDSALDNLLGTATDRKEEPSEIVESTDKEEKKQQDFEKAFFKEKALRKAAEEKVKSFETVPAQNQDETSHLDEEGVQFLKKIVREAIGEVGERGEAVKEIKSKPYFDILEPKILEIADSLPDSLSDRDRLSQAYDRAAAQNIDLIVETALEVGRQDGFKNRSFKSNQGSVKETPKLGSSNKDNQLERYNKGTLSDEEYFELREDGTLEKWDKQAFNIL